MQRRREGQLRDAFARLSRARYSVLSFFTAPVVQVTNDRLRRFLETSLQFKIVRRHGKTSLKLHFRQSRLLQSHQCESFPRISFHESLHGAIVTLRLRETFVGERLSAMTVPQSFFEQT